MSASAGSALRLDATPEDVGLDRERLERIERHYRRYLDDGRLAGWLVAIVRHDRLVYLRTAGSRDLEASLPVEPDTLWRIYSMTKPITSVAAMMLWEEGAFELKDEVARFIPSFADARVWRGGSALKPVTEPVTEPLRVWHLLTHTAGLTYGFHHSHPVDRLYREAGFEWGSPPDLDLAGACDAWADLPLLFQPGAEWNYSVATDVLGRVIEVVSGQSLDAFFAERILEPLGMHDTSFGLRDGDAERLAALYSPDPQTGKAVRNDVIGQAAYAAPAFLSGGGGLLSTAADYLRFMRMLLGRGELDGVRLLGPRTVAYMARNHLPGNADLETYGRPLFSESAFDGIGFGLGFSVVLDPAAGKVPSSVGELAWGGAASTAFYLDPLEDLGVLFLTQLLPSSAHPIRPQLRQLVSQALID
jgi:CubicO group peptidase (beta-lactamase class C family)